MPLSISGSGGAFKKRNDLLYSERCLRAHSTCSRASALFGLDAASAGALSERSQSPHWEHNGRCLVSRCACLGSNTMPCEPEQHVTTQEVDPIFNYERTVYGVPIDQCNVQRSHVTFPAACAMLLNRESSSDSLYETLSMPTLSMDAKEGCSNLSAKEHCMEFDQIWCQFRFQAQQKSLHF